MSDNSEQQSSEAESQQSPPRKKRRHINKRQAVLLETGFGVYSLFLIAGGAALFDPHSAPAIFSYCAGASAAIAGFAIHYRHLYQNKRTVAWRFFLPLVVVHLFMIAGLAINWTDRAASSSKPMIDVTPRSLNNFASGFRTGIGMTFKNNGGATAYSVTSDVSVAILPFPLPPDRQMPSMAQVHGSRGTLAPGGEIDGYGQMDNPVTVAQIAAIADGSDLRLYVAGTLSYRLSSGQKCARRFLWETGGPELIASIKAMEEGQHTLPPWWEGDRFNDLTPACR